jgi:hypothetical protein
MTTTKAAPIELSEEMTAALSEEGELSEELANRLVDQLRPREQNGERTYGQPPRWHVPIESTIGSYMSRAEADVLCLTERTKQAWRVVLAAHEAVQTALASRDSLAGDRALEDRAADEAVAELVRAGKTPKLPAGLDWAGEERTRAAVLRVRVEELAKARSKYEKVATAEGPRRRQGALDRVETTKAAADELVPAALAAFNTWRAAVGEALALLEALEGPRGQLSRNARHLGEDASRTLREGQAASGAMAALLGSDHPWLSAAYLTDRGPLDLPLWARAAIADGRSEGNLADLAALEVEEDFKITAYGRRYALAHGMIRR